MTTTTVRAKQLRRKQLSNVLDSFEEANRRDVAEYTSGHLNESRLYDRWSDAAVRPPGHGRWQSSSRIPLPSHQSSLDTRKHSDKNDGVRHLKRARDEATFVGVTEDTRRWLFGDSGSVVPTITRRRSSEDVVSTMSWANPVLADDDRWSQQNLRRRRPYRAWSKADMSPNTGCAVPAALHGTTRREQYRNKRGLEYDARPLSPNKMAAKLKERIRCELARLGADRKRSGNFHRMQIFSGCFEELIGYSAAIGPVLRMCKREYDAYVAQLLDGQFVDQDVLDEQLSASARTSGEHTSGEHTSGALSKCVARVRNLENEAADLLHEQEKLCESLTAFRMSGNDGDVPTSASTEAAVSRDRQQEVAGGSERIEQLHASVHRRMERLDGVLRGTGTKLVPAALVAQMEAAIREIEIEIEKLMSEKDHFGRCNKSLRRQLRSLLPPPSLVNCPTTDSAAAAKVWQKIDSETERASAAIGQKPASSYKVLLQESTPKGSFII